MISWIYPSELQLNEANSFDTEAPFLAMFQLKFMINRMIVNFQFLDEIFHSYGIYILQLNRFCEGMF